MRGAKRILAACCLGLPVPAGALDFLLHQYTVSVDPALVEMRIEACFTEVMPERLLTSSRRATEHLLAAEMIVDRQTVSLVPRGLSLPIPIVPDDRCVRYRVNIAGIVKARSFSAGMRVADAVILAPAVWLWRPPDLDSASDIAIDFVLPGDMAVSAPWRRASDRDNRFLVGHRPLYWPAAVAIGRFHRAPIEVAGARIDVAILNGPAEVDPHTAREWLRNAARAVTLLYGRFPVPRVQILLIAVPGGNDAAPYATTARGGGPAVHVAMNASASPALLASDWVGVHELTHLALPFVSRRDAWLSEGFASYYQNVLRARAGMLSPEQAWRALLDGFNRGDRGTDQTLTLAQATPRMHERNQIMRVYWSGAAILFMADVELRRQSNNKQSLDSVLQEFQACCLEPDRQWRARELLERLDALSDTTVFTELHDKYAYSRHFPNLRPLLNELGVQTTGGRIVLDTQAPLAAVRDAIMRPASPEPAPAEVATRQ